MKDHIQLSDWAGNVLFTGHYQDPEVTRILKLNDASNDGVYLDLVWVDETDERNPWEFVAW